jgi:DNA polymerase III epsilon subunit-like protein
VWLHERDGLGRRRTSLADLAAALGLPSRHPHDAVSDALTTAQAFVVLASHLDARRAETVHSLAAATQRLELLQAYPSR